MSLTVLGLIVAAVVTVCWYLAHLFVVAITNTVFGTLVPVAVLVINVVVAVQVRRAASNAAANLGVQPHHQTSTSNNSAVPTVMLIATSLIFTLFYGTLNILYAVWWWMYYHNPIGGNIFVLAKIYKVIYNLINLVFAYNFYVYLITGKQFRAELRKLFSRCLPSSHSSAPATPAAAAAVA